MKSQGVQENTTGNGPTVTPILAHEEGLMEAQLKPARASTSIASRNTSSDKPLTPAEALSLLQTRCFDLRTLGVKVEILADGGALFAAFRLEGHELGFDTGRGDILLDGAPVVKG